MKNLITNSRTRWLGMVICTCMLLLGNAHAYASDPHFSFTNASTSWTGSKTEWFLSSPANTSWDEYCTYMWMNTNDLFSLNNGTNRYGPDSDQKAFAAGQQDYRNNSFKYTGTSGLVRICAAQSSSREWYPYLWLDTSLETAILQGSKIMFYFGISSSWKKNWLFLSKPADKTTNLAYKQYYKMKDQKCSSDIAVAYVDAGVQYYISWDGSTAGVQMAANAQAGNLYSLYSENNVNKIAVNAGSIPAFSSATYDHVAGIAASSISATASNSIYGYSQTIKYYYTTSSNPASASFTAFDPSDISGLSAGTYYLYALGWDGHILVRSNVATLTVRDVPGISLSIEDGSSNVITGARSGDVITLVAAPSNCGSTPTISYRYSTSSSFNTYTQIASTTSTSTTWTVPTSTSNQTFYLRAYVTSPGYECNTDNSTLTAYGKKTIHVRNNNNWSAFKIHHWGTNDINPTTWGPSLPSCTSDGGQWYSVDIYSCADGFVLTNGSNGNQNVTVDLTYGQSNPTLTNGSYYEMSTSGSNKQTLSLSSEPVAPTVTLTVDKINVDQITLTGTITVDGRDGGDAAHMQEVGFYLGATKHTASYKNGMTFTKTITSLSANNTYSAKAYAINVAGEGKSSATSVTTLTNTTYRIKVQVPNGDVPHIYAWTDADSYGGSRLTNITGNADLTTGNAPTMTSDIDGSAYDWYYYDLHNRYEHLLFYTTKNSNNSQDLTATRSAQCYWYNKSNSPRAGTMDCPVLTTNLYIGDKDAADENHTYYEMSGSTPKTKTLSLAANHNYEFKIVYNTEFYGKASTTVTRDGKTNNAVNVGTASAGAAYIYLTTDFAGDYTITFNESTKAITVTYPTAYVVTFSKSIVGTDNGTTSAPSASYAGPTAVASGDLVPNGTSVTFTAATEGSGYEWKGWYSVADPSADYDQNKLSGNANYVATISASTTIYAVYKETIHTVSVVAHDGYGNSHGSVSTGSVTAGVATKSATITATPENKAWRFKHWVIAPGISAADGYDTHSNPLKINATTDDITLIAYFEPRYALMGSLAETEDPAGGMPSPTWNDESAADFAVISFTSVGTDNGVDLECTRTLEPNKTYKFQVLDREIKTPGEYNEHTRLGLSSATVLPTGESRELTVVNGSGDVRIQTVGRGDYTFKITKLSSDATSNRPTITVDRQASWLVSIGQGYEDIDGGIHSNSSTGGTMSATATESGTTVAITNGQYIASGGTLAYTNSPETGYTFGGWYGTSDYSTSPFDWPSFVVSTENANVYAKFVETETSVTISHNTHGHVTVGGVTATSTTVGITTTRALVAVPDAGYYFAGWEVPVGADFELQDYAGGEDAEVTLHGLGTGTAGTLTANFVELDKIYFRNENENTGGKLWDVDKMYVYFNVGWANDGEQYGGVNNLGTNAEMNPISAGSHIFWAYVPRSFTTGGNGKVAFSDNWMGTETYPGGTYTKFYQGNGVYRTDYTRNFLNMYVPACAKKYTSNETNYFDNGYWAQYDTHVSMEAGYYLKEGNKDNQVDVFKATADNSTKLVAKYRFQNSNEHDFFIASAAGKFYKVKSKIDNLACTNVDLVDDAATPAGFKIKPTSEGYYTFYIEQAGDTMKLSIVYPVSPGDYRLLYTYNTDKTHTSDVFKPDDASATNVKKSMYIDRTNAVSLKLQKCSGINPSTKLPVWTSGYSISLDNFPAGKKGVYEFDMAITDGRAVNLDVASVTLNNVALYEGPFYIKTDYAPGGWVNYERNVLHQNTINFDKNDAKTFDYYHCAWIGDGDKNVKCIIANDYNQQITDTLIGDDILGKYWEGGVQKDRQYLATEANVRFSYNSYTNELKRAYINGATDWQKKFLCVSAGGDGIIRAENGDAFEGNSATFTDNNNWIYMLDLQAYEGARVKLTADYRFEETDHKQFLIGEDGSGSYADAYTQEILGGDGETWQTLRMVYDFKTNHLLTAWLATGTTLDADKTLNTNIMVIRDNQEDARQIKLGGYKIDHVDTAYSVVHLTREHLTNKTAASGYVSDGTLTRTERQFYWVSFPYDVKISDIFGSMGNYGEDWIMQRYDGKKRAKNGFWQESSTNWTFMSKSETLNKFEGYVLTLDLSEFGYISADQPGKWANNVVDLYLYFPSSASIENIETQTDYVVKFKNQSEYYCEINRSEELGGNGEPLGAEYDRTKRDSYWHCIGIPSFAAYNGAKDASGTIINWGHGEGEDIDWETDDLPFLYEWNKTTNTLAPTSTSAFTFKPMQAYLVQYGGATMTWSTVVAPKASSIVARRKARMADTQFAEFNLNILRGEEKLDHTYVRLTDNEDVTADFEFGHDLCKEFQPGANIYTLIDQLEVAGNSMPLSEQTTIVPVGVKIAANGTYTFSMPEGTNGIGVVLIDNITGARTNLGLTDYEVSLTAGKIDDRFLLEISPIQPISQGIDEAYGEGLEANGVRKVLIDNVLYIVKDGKVFDARGAKIK